MTGSSSPCEYSFLDKWLFIYALSLSKWTSPGNTGTFFYQKRFPGLILHIHGLPFVQSQILKKRIPSLMEDIFINKEPAAPVAERLIALFFNRSIISPP